MKNHLSDYLKLSESNFLENFFNLYLKSSNITSLMLVDTISFISKNKKCLRLILSPKELKAFRSICKKTEYSIVSYPILSEKKGNTWNSLEKDDTNEQTQSFLVIASLTKDNARSCLNAEINGDVFLAGQFFDYPKCCIQFYEKFLQYNPQNWALSILDSSGNGPYPYYANRIASGWSGNNFAAELFPCSLKCELAIKIGKDNERSFYKLGLEKLAEKIKIQSLSSCVIRQNGSVVKYHKDYKIKNNDNLIHFTDLT